MTMAVVTSAARGSKRLPPLFRVSVRLKRVRMTWLTETSGPGLQHGNDLKRWEKKKRVEGGL